MAQSLPRSGRRGGLRQPTNFRARGGKLPLRARLDPWNSWEGDEPLVATPVRENGLRHLTPPNHALAGRRRCEKACGWREQRAFVYAAEQEEMKGDELASSLAAITKQLDFSVLYGDGSPSMTEEGTSCWMKGRYLTYEPLDDQENRAPNVDCDDVSLFPDGTADLKLNPHKECSDTTASYSEALDSTQPLLQLFRKATPMKNTWTLDSPTSDSATDSRGAATKKRKHHKRSHRSRNKTPFEDRRPNLCILQRMFGP